MMDWRASENPTRLCQERTNGPAQAHPVGRTLRQRVP